MLLKYSILKIKTRIFPTRPDWVGGVCLVSLVVMLFSCSAKETGYSVKEGPFQQSIIEKGELEAINVSSILPPRLNYTSQMKIVWIAEHGTMVHKGDTIVRFDPSVTEKEVENQQGLVTNVEISLRRLDLSDETANFSVAASLENQMGSYELSKLQMERAQFETEKQKMIAEMRFQQAELQLAKVKRSVARLPVTQKYERRGYDVLLKQRIENVKKARNEINQLVLFSPSDGLMQISSNQTTGYPFKEGDVVNSSYYAIATIPDVSQMKIKTRVREVDITKVKPGTEVIVRLDALPSVAFKGVVTYVSKICLRRNDGIKSFDAEVVVQDRDSRLKPGMSVNCEFISYGSKNDLFVPNNCLLRTDTAEYVFIPKGSSALRVKVTAGPSNNHYTVIRSDLKTGQNLVPVEEVLNEKNE